MTHKEIAKIAHVSVSTVSKALSGSRDISTDIAKQIIQIAIDIGYFKEKNKRSFENKREFSVVIAIVCPEIISIHYSSVITQIKKEVEARGGQTAVYIYDFDQQKKDDLIKMLILRNLCDGIVLFGKHDFKSQHNIPVLCMDNNPTDNLCDYIYTDYTKVIGDTILYLKNLGHTKIGFIGETRTTSKQKCFENSMEICGLEINPDNLYMIDKRFEEIGYEAADIYMKAENKPTAFIAAYDEVALAFVQKLSRNGYRIPEDVSVVGINDIPFSSYAHTPLTTVRIMFEDGLGEAINILFDEILNNLPSGHKIPVKHKLIIRETTAEVKND